MRIWSLAIPPVVLACTPGRWSRSPSTVRHLRLGLESAAAEWPTGSEHRVRVCPQGRTAGIGALAMVSAKKLTACLRVSYAGKERTRWLKTGFLWLRSNWWLIFFPFCWMDDGRARGCYRRESEWELIFAFLICYDCYGDWADRMERVRVVFLIWSHEAVLDGIVMIQVYVVCTVKKIL